MNLGDDARGSCGGAARGVGFTAVELLVDEGRIAGRRSLFRFEDGSQFAYARRQEFIRCSDGTPWAYVSGDRLISARSGQCHAVRAGNLYYDAACHAPFYYEHP